MGKKKYNPDNLPDAQKIIDILVQQKEDLEQRLIDIRTSFSISAGQQQRLLYKNAFNSYKKYIADPRRCLYYTENPDVVLNGFRLDLDKLDDIKNKDPKSYFLLFGKRPTGIFSRPGEIGTPTNPQHGNQNAFSYPLTLMILGLDENNKFIVDVDPETQQDKPIVYEYLSPCPNSCDGVDAEIDKYFR